MPASLLRRHSLTPPDGGVPSGPAQNARSRSQSPIMMPERESSDGMFYLQATVTPIPADIDLDALPLTAHVMAIQDLREGRLWGFEVLVRGLLRSEIASPIELMEIAKQQNCLTQFDRRCFQATTRVAMTLPPDILAFVNIYAQTLLEPGGVDFALDTVKPLLDARRQVVIEIHESMTAGEAKEMQPIFARLKNAGVRIALDDLLPQNLTFNHLKVRPDFIKVDRGIFSGMTSVESARTINTLARCQESLGYELIVEGIEDRAMLSITTFAGAWKGQGYLFGKPAPPST